MCGEAREVEHAGCRCYVNAAWHARSDAASSLVVSVGIVGNLLGYPILDPIAALIVGFMVAKMGWSFGWGNLVSAAARFDGSRSERGSGGGDSQDRCGDAGRQKRAQHPHSQDG